VSTTKLNTDVIVVGAGPAGAGTSFFLSKQGIDHVVIDKETFPRDKVCGDACSGKTALVIERANPEWLQEIFAESENYMPSWGMSFVAANGKQVDIPFRPKEMRDGSAPGFTASRLVFDNFLFRKIQSAHNKVFQGALIKRVERNDGQMDVQMSCDGTDYEICAKVIVGCDGDKSIIRRNFFKKDTTTKSDAVGLRAYFEGVEGLQEDNFLEVHFLKEMLPGYFWIFPLPGGMANVGVGILSERVRKKKINLREQMLHAIKNNPALAPRFKNAKLIDKIHGWGLPLASNSLTLSTDNVLLAGDAASLVDPFSGEGIGNAMYSGMLAAHAINTALRSGDFSAAFFREHYDSVVNRRLGEEFKVSGTLQQLCKYPWIFNMVVNKAQKSKTLRDSIGSMFYDMQLREQVKKPSFYLKILLNR
jgi:geranylgeranyl reductase family protein